MNTETEEMQIARIENFILADVYKKDKVSIKTLRYDLLGFRSPRDPNGNQKLTREEIDSIVPQLYKKGLLRKQQGFVWIPFNSKTFEKLSELGVLEKLPRSMPDNIKIVAKTDQFDFYDLFKEIRLKHSDEIVSITNKLTYLLPGVSVSTYLLPSERISVDVNMCRNLEWPIEISSSNWLADLAAKLKPQIKAINPNNKFEGLYKVIIKCFQDFEPDPSPLREQQIVDTLLMRGYIRFDDPVLKYSLSNVRRWAINNKLPKDLLEFLRRASKLKAKSKPEEFTAKMEN